MNRIYYLVITCLLFLIACSTSNQSFENEYTYLYDNKESLIKPDFKIYHHDSDSSTLFFQINTSDILYSNIGSDTGTNAKVLIKYKLRSFDNKATVIDTATYPLIDFGLNKANAIIQSNIKFACQSGNLYRLEVRLRDEYKDLNVVHHLIVDKRQNVNQQYFLVKSKGKVLCSNIASDSRTVLIEKSKLVRSDEFIIETENNEYKKAFPPFAMAKLNEKIYKPEISDSIRFENNQLELLLKDKVTRFIPADTINQNNYKLYLRYFHSGFPELTKMDQMIEPIRYISTTNEYNNMIEAIDKKQAFEAFWLQLARDEKAAKTLIREYYSRVELANKNFSSFKQGWKTDRGIIYIVYGKPYKVIRELNKEIWLYGEDNNILSVKFEFKRIQTDWTNNDFELTRDANYKNNWYRAVDVWRQGRVY